MDTLLLNANWDLSVDADNNIALATDAYAIAQDVASAARTFLGEVWYNNNLGVPYLPLPLSGVVPTAAILGQRPSIPYTKAQLIAAGMTVPGVAAIKAFLTGPDLRTRALGGQLQITSTTGAFAVTGGPLQSGGIPWYVSAVSS